MFTCSEWVGANQHDNEIDHNLRHMQSVINYTRPSSPLEHREEGLGTRLNFTKGLRKSLSGVVYDDFSMEESIDGPQERSYEECTH